MGTETKDPRISARSAKDTILKAYETMKAQRDALREGAMEPAAVAKEQERSAREGAREYIDSLGGFRHRVVDFDNTVRSFVDTLKHNIEERENELHLLEKTIEDRKEFVKELSGIEAEINTLAALTQARTEMEDKWRLERDAAGRAHKAALAKLLEDRAEAERLFQDEAAKSKDEAIQDENRRHAEWAYEFDRNCKMKRDAFNDELKAKGDAHNEAIQKGLKDLQEQELALEEREAKVGEVSYERERLQKELEIAAAGRDEAIEAAVTKARSEEAGKREAAINAITSQHRAKLEVAEERVKMREESATQLRAQISVLQADLKAAQGQINELAMKSLDSSHALQATQAIRSMAEQTTVAAGKTNSKN